MSTEQKTKYGPTRHNPGYSYGERWEWIHVLGNPRMTDHVLERWDERTPINYPCPEHAWEHGVDVSDLRYAFQDRRGQIPAEARYYYDECADCGVVLLVSDGVCKTVYLEDYVDETAKAMLKGTRELVDNE